MPKLLSASREKFCCYLVEGLNQTEAYIKSRSDCVMRRETAATAASRLLKEPEILSRIEEIRRPVVEKARKKFEFNLEEEIANCDKAQELAQAMLQPNVMLQAVTLRARLAGRLEGLSGDKKKTPFDEVSTEELVKLLEFVRKHGTESGAPSLKLVK